jgi:hydroxymethylpyrimidine pyrophosphatase-like HAD family hydrolase
MERHTDVEGTGAPEHNGGMPTDAPLDLLPDAPALPLPRQGRPVEGLLLDVDGPIASPVTRTVPPGIIADLVTLASAGWPVVFNTGRSDAFIREQVMQPMLAAGLPAGITFHAVCEKGATWFSFTADGAGEVFVDQDLALPVSFADDVRDLVEEKYSHLMFFDETKLAMVSVEQSLSAANADYLVGQRAFDDDALEIMHSHDMGACRLDREEPDSHGDIAYRVDPTIISTDLESVRVGKDVGAERALTLVAPLMEIPRTWWTVGDSRTDYAMADYLHEQGFDVAHVDVRPADGVPAKPYDVVTEGGLIHEEAGAAFLARCVASLG